MHVHVGRAAPAGLLATEEEAVTSHALAGAHGVVFRLKEPGGYREPNERVLQLAHTSDGRITALARLDPGDDRPARRSARAQAASAGGGVRPRRPAARRRVRARRRETAPRHDPGRSGRARDDRSGAPPQPGAPGGAADPGALRRRHLRRHQAPDRRAARSCSWPSTAAPPARTARTARTATFARPLLEQIEGRTDRDPLRQHALPGSISPWSLPPSPAPPTRPSLGANGLRRGRCARSAPARPPPRHRWADGRTRGSG
jgi:hypothetical protein